MLFRLSFALMLPMLLTAQAAPMERFQINGDWCFIERPHAPTEKAVIIIHGNGELVSESGSSWEKKASSNRMSDELVAKGLLVAQSNARAIPDNGMWGNADSQAAVVALQDRLKRVEKMRSFQAIAVSAGNLTLLHLVMSGAAPFERAVMIAPVTSLASLYRCPNKVDRVGQISRSFGFSPASACPGNPETDTNYRRATKGFDPTASTDWTADQTERLRRVHWLMLYEENDPKVPPSENILALISRLRKIGADVQASSVPSATHASAELFDRNREQAVGWLSGQPR